MELQTTIKQPFTVEGPGLHTGGFITVKVMPAPANSGVTFCRTDLQQHIFVPAVADYVAGTNHGTTLCRDEASISTIEHLMSALHGLRVDNVLVELNGPEVPILDGSARIWVEKLRQAGIVEQEEERRYFNLNQTVRWTDSDAGIELVAEPADHFEVDSTIVFESVLIGSQSAKMVGYDQYVSDFAPCRTFVFLHEVEMLLAANLIKGGALDNALVFVDKPLSEESRQHLARVYNRDAASIESHNGVLNTVEPYFPNEPARHKLLDFVGDIALVGVPVHARFTLRCPGHRANAALALDIRRLLIQEAPELLEKRVKLTD